MNVENNGQLTNDAFLPPEMIYEVMLRVELEDLSSLSSVSQVFHQLSQENHHLKSTLIQRCSERRYTLPITYNVGNYQQLLETNEGSDLILALVSRRPERIEKLNQFYYELSPSPANGDNLTRLRKFTHEANGEETTYLLPFDHSQVKAFAIFNESMAFVIIDGVIHVVSLNEEEPVDFCTIEGIDDCVGLSFSEDRRNLYVFNGSNQFVVIPMKTTNQIVEISPNNAAPLPPSSVISRITNFLSGYWSFFRERLGY